MKWTLLVGVCAVMLGACGGSSSYNVPEVCEQSPTCNVNPPPPPPTAAEQLIADLQGLSLDNYYTTSIAALVRRSPETVIWRSLQDVYPLATATLDDLSDEYQRETFELYQIALDALRTYDRSILDAAGQLNYDIYEWYLQDVVDRLPFIYHNYVATYGNFGVPRDTEQLFTEVHPIDSVQDAQDYIARLGGVEKKFAELVNHLEQQRQNGIIEPALTMQVAINQISSMASINGTASPYYTAFVEMITGHPAINSTQQTNLSNQALNVVNGGVRRGYQNLLSKLQELLPMAPAQIGVGQFPNGSAYYDYTVKHHTTTDLTAAEIHQLGLDELTRIHAEMRVIFDQLGYPQNETLPELFARVTADGGIIPAANVQSTYETIIDLARQNVGDAFDIFPSTDVVVIGGTFGGYYIGPSRDGTRPGAFYAGTTTEHACSQASCALDRFYRGMGAVCRARCL